MSSSSGRFFELEAPEESQHESFVLLRQHLDEEPDLADGETQRVHFEFENVLLEVC